MVDADIRLAELPPAPPGRLRRSAWAAPLLPLYLLALFFSAFLLFSVQPMFAKIVLPKLGGSPSVWAISLCFFQTALLAGYAYAFLLNRYCSDRLGAILHLALLTAAIFALPVGLAPAFTDPPPDGAYLWTLQALALGVGLPFFAISANAPLLQAWFSRGVHPGAQDPYFLYGASNLGSLLALLTYPLLFEPFLGLGFQSAVWSVGFVALICMIAVVALVFLSVPTASPGALTTAAEPADHLRWSQRFGWMLLAFIPSGLLVAFTTYLTTDIASAPFIWLPPLALFLLTFVLAFRQGGDTLFRIAAMLQIPLLTLVICFLGWSDAESWKITCVAGVGAFFATSLVCHRELYESRPSANHLTEFYLWMSLGGVLGGIFAAIIAPNIFRTIYEFPLLLLLGMAVRPSILAALKGLDRRAFRNILIAIMTGLGLLIALKAIVAYGLITYSPGLHLLIALAIGIAAFVTRREVACLVTLAAIMAGMVFLLPSPFNEGQTERSFFGILKVIDSDNGAMHVLYHGVTVHGAQRFKTADGAPVAAPVPATYYHPASPIALGLDAARAIAGGGGPMHIGIIGLGAGSMACYVKPGDVWTFFEIDPAVIRIARDPKSFTYLSHCQPDANIIVGDARLKLASEAPERFDYLLVDAFSSDAVPVHLITREALALDLSKLKPDGVLVLHLSNRHLDLLSVASRTLATLPGVHFTVAADLERPAELDALGSAVIYATKSKAAFEQLERLPYIGKTQSIAALQPWTDDFSNVLAALIAKYWAR
ncbi:MULTISPECIES: fused MFS/spermidine synthase [Rhodomicrobium]|uniref:fused MFS/spermidine synthase n=1 Tax=Rhodomicrobium TaxID=1068 RepID=UPI000B4BFE9C|nr:MULTISPECIES: fused MFS/spermidine synthase [Rhodomicrobium]